MFIGAEGCGEEIVFIPIGNSKTLRIEKLLDDSNYFLMATTEQKKSEIEGLLYQDNLKKWQDVDMLINSIKSIQSN